MAAARSRPIQSYAIKVYEERRQESLKIMDELNNKFDKIQEVISFIEVGVVRYNRRFACVRACVRACFVLATVCDLTYIVATFVAYTLASAFSTAFVRRLHLYVLLFMRTTRRTDVQDS